MQSYFCQHYFSYLFRKLKLMFDNNAKELSDAAFSAAKYRHITKKEKTHTRNAWSGALWRDCVARPSADYFPGDLLAHSTPAGNQRLHPRVRAETDANTYFAMLVNRRRLPRDQGTEWNYKAVRERRALSTFFLPSFHRNTRFPFSLRCLSIARSIWRTSDAGNSGGREVRGGSARCAGKGRRVSDYGSTAGMRNRSRMEGSGGQRGGLIGR